MSGNKSLIGHFSENFNFIFLLIKTMYYIYFFLKIILFLSIKFLVFKNFLEISKRTQDFSHYTDNSTKKGGVKL